MSFSSRASISCQIGKHFLNDIDKIVSILRQGIIQSMEELKSKDLWHN